MNMIGVYMLKKNSDKYTKLRNSDKILNSKKKLFKDT